MVTDAKDRDTFSSHSAFAFLPKDQAAAAEVRRRLDTKLLDQAVGEIVDY